MAVEIVRFTNNSTWNPNLPMLPPCAVCGAKASGVHYGVNTCAPCKAFYRRAMSLNLVYESCKRDNCVNIRRCAYCRMQKCLKVGMSKDAIKGGRYTLAKRNRDIEEVKKLELQSRIKADGASQVEDVHLQHRDNMINELTSLLLNLSTFNKGYQSDLLEKEKDYLKNKAMQQMLFGSLNPIPREEYDKIYRATGIDVDNRQSFIVRVLHASSQSMISVQRFCDCIPGYKGMIKSDQIALYKSAVYDSYIMLFSWYYNLDAHVCVHPMDDELIYTPEDIMALTYDREGHVFKWKLMRRVQELDLTIEETAIATALCVMNADANLSRDGKNITDACTDYLLEALSHLCSLNHDPEELTMMKIMRVMVDFREPKYQDWIVEIRELFAEILSMEELVKAGCYSFVDWVWNTNYTCELS